MSLEQPSERRSNPDRRKVGDRRSGDRRGRVAHLAAVVRAGAPAPQPPHGGSAESQAVLNARLWSSGRYLRSYDHAQLWPAESVIMARYRDALSGRVLDVGCGAGRMIGYLIMLGADVHGVDIAPAMVEHCRRRFPGLDVRVGDLAEISTVVDGPFDAILMPDNLIDVFDDEGRRRALRQLRDLLSQDGLLIFSSHNLASWDHNLQAGAEGRVSQLKAIVRKAAKRDPVWWFRAVMGVPESRRNRRRLGPLQYREADHAVINDPAHWYGLLHYYIGRVDQERQLEELGYRLIDALESDGPTVPAGQEGRSGSLYYVAGTHR